MLLLHPWAVRRPRAFSCPVLLGRWAVGVTCEAGACFAEEEEGAADEDGAGALRKALFSLLQGFGEGGGKGAG